MPGVTHTGVAIPLLTLALAGGLAAQEQGVQKHLGSLPGSGSASVERPAQSPSSLSPLPAGSAPLPQAIEPITLTATKSGTNVLFSWSGQAAPITLLTSTDPTWQVGVQAILSGSGVTNVAQPLPAAAVQFFNVTDGTTVSPASQGIGYDPKPNPTTPTFLATRRWWGDTLTLNASNLDKIGPANHAELYFQSIPANGPPSMSGDISFTIPDDARSTYLTLNVNGRSSPASGAPFLDLRPPITLSGSPLTFSGISSIAYAPCRGGHIFVADNAAIYDVDLFKRAPTATLVVMNSPFGTHNYLSRVTTDGKLLYVSSQAGHPDIMYIDACSASPTPQLFAHMTDAMFTRSVEAAGVAARPDGAAAYIPDVGSGYTVKVPASAGAGGGAIVDQWGGNVVLSFADPCGTDVSPYGTLVVSATTATYIVPSTGGTTTFQNGNNPTVHSIEIDREASPSTIARQFGSSGPGLAEAFNLNLPTKLGGVVFAQNDGSLILSSDTFYQVEHQLAQRVLLSNSAQDGIQFPYASTYQAADRMIRVDVEGWGGIPVYVKVVDPPDAAPYTAPFTPPVYHANDNTATVTMASDWGLTTDPDGTNPQPCIAVTPPSNVAPASFYLKAPVRYSGDNFRVEVSKTDWGVGCNADNRIVSMSPLYTSWKRVFVERDRMFRRGGLLDVDAIPGAATIFVSKLNGARVEDLTPGDIIAIFDTASPFEGAHDERCVTSVDASGTGVQVNLGRKSDCVFSMGAGLTRNYSASNSLASGYWTFANGRSAGVGVISGCDGLSNQLNSSSCFFDADLRNIEGPFGDGFVEFEAPRAGMSSLPFLAQPWFANAVNDIDTLARLSQLWFVHFIDSGNGNPPPNVPHNYFHLIGASMGPMTASLFGGVTSPLDDSSLIFVGSIETHPDVPGDTAAANRLVTIHEMGHQFALNGSDPIRHDSRPAWCDPSPNNHCGLGGTTHYCIMHIPSAGSSQYVDGVNYYCVNDLFIGPDTTIRAASDPR